MKHTTLVNYALYQAGWFGCVLGAAWRHPWIGLAVALALAAAHLLLSRERAIEVRLMLLAAAVGFVVETAQLAAGTYRFPAGTIAESLPPPWLLALWLQIATAFRYSLRRIVSPLVPAVLFGAIGGPVAFLAGARLGAVEFLPPVTSGLLRLSLAWMAALALFSVATRRVLPLDAPAPQYRLLRCLSDRTGSPPS